MARHGVTSRTLFQSFDWRVLVTARRLEPELATAALADRGTVYVWTVNDPGELDALLARGVDGIATAFPDRLRAVLAARGLPLRPRYADPQTGPAVPA